MDQTTQTRYHRSHVAAKPTVQRRFADYFAVITVAIEQISRIAGMAWFEEVALNATLTIFDQATQECIEEKTADRVLSDVADWASANRQHFVTNGAAGISAGGKTLGRIKDREYVAVLAKDLTSFLRDHCKVTSVPMLLKEWQSDGVLRFDKGMTRKTVLFQGEYKKMICFEWSRLYRAEETSTVIDEQLAEEIAAIDDAVHATMSSATGRLIEIREFKQKDGVINRVTITGFGELILLPQRNNVLLKLLKANVIYGEESPDQVTMHYSPSYDGTKYIQDVEIRKGVYS